MYCTNCGAQVPDNAAFCTQCGTALRRPAQPAQQRPAYQQPAQPRPAYQQSAQQRPAYQQPAQPRPAYQQNVQQPVRQSVPQPAPVQGQPRENVGMGIVGAIAGAIVGGLSIILFSQMGMVSALSGLLLAVGTLFGYEKLGGRISVTGVIVCIVLMLITPYLADRLDWAILINKELGYSLSRAFRYIHDFVDFDAYIENLLMIYGFTALGAVGTIIKAFKKK